MQQIPPKIISAAYTYAVGELQLNNTRLNNQSINQSIRYFLRYSMSKNVVTFKSQSRANQGH